MFNALRYTEDLEKAGFTGEQAKASLKILIEVMDESFATKSDLLITKSDLETQIRAVRTDLSAEIQLVRSEIQSVRSDLKTLESTLTIRLGSMMVIGLGVITALIKMH